MLKPEEEFILLSSTHVLQIYTTSSNRILKAQGCFDNRQNPYRDVCPTYLIPKTERLEKQHGHKPPGLVVGSKAINLLPNRPGRTVIT